MMDSTLFRPFTAFSFNQFLAEHKLAGSKCTDCGGLYLPPRAICPACHSGEMEWIETSGRGRLAAFTSIVIGPSFMNQQGFGRDNPYVTGIVELDEGPKISAWIVEVDARNPASIVIGSEMVVEFVHSNDKTFLAFKPTAESPSS